MRNLPLVSVIIPVYNGAKFLEEALLSVIAQDYSNIEVIVVDDGSTDNTREIAQSFREVQYHYQENQGVSVARNTAISRARGEYIAFLDADDIWNPRKLSVQIEIMLKHPEFRITTTDKTNFLEPGTQLPRHLEQLDDWESMEENIPSTMVVHKSVFEEIGTFSPHYRASEDTEWIWRATDAEISIKKIDKNLVKRRLHGANLSWIMVKDHKANLMRILRESVARKRDAKAVFDKSRMDGYKHGSSVSTIIVVLNGEAYLSEAIESVLSQSFPPNEILVVDGNSTDKSAQIARSYPEVTLMKQQGSGLADARNFGIEHASGGLIAFLDSDDLWHPEKLKIQVSQFMDSPEIQYSFSNVKLFLQPGCELRKGYKWHFLNEEQKGRTPGTLVVRKSLFDQVGKFDPSYKIACDVEWFTRVKDYQIKSAFTSQTLLHKRLHNSNLSGDVKTNRSELLDVIRKSVERKKNFQQAVR